MVKRRSMDDYEKEQVRRMFKCGYYDPEIGQFVGFSRCAIRHYRQSLGITAQQIKARRRTGWFDTSRLTRKEPA